LVAKFSPLLSTPELPQINGCREALDTIFGNKIYDAIRLLALFTPLLYNQPVSFTQGFGAVFAQRRWARFWPRTAPVEGSQGGL